MSELLYVALCLYHSLNASLFYVTLEHQSDTFFQQDEYEFVYLEKGHCPVCRKQDPNMQQHKVGEGGSVLGVGKIED